jgi:phosphatidylglycerophosphate synthase
MTVSGLLNAIFDLANSLVEIYLANIIKPFLVLHEKAYKALNTILRAVLDDHSSQIPDWFTANAITYVRTWTIIPCIFLLNKGHTVLPSLIILSVDFGDFLDGVVARFWMDQKEIEAVAQAADAESKDKVNMQDSWVVTQRNKNYGGFIDAVCDKVFVVPCWICLLASVPDAGHVRILQYVVLWALILTEAASGSIRFKAYYTSNGVSAPTVTGLDFSSSAVKADHIGKAKQTFEMFGTAFFVLSPFRYFGLLLLAAAVPLAYESVRRKINKRVMYCDGSTEKIDHETLKFWKQAKGLGSKLIVGITSDNKDMIANASACESVDCVLVNAPAKLSISFLESHGIDYVVCGVGNSESVVSSELTAAKRCLVIIDDNTCKPMDSKAAKSE